MNTREKHAHWLAEVDRYTAKLTARKDYLKGYAQRKPQQGVGRRDDEFVANSLIAKDTLMDEYEGERQKAVQLAIMYGIAAQIEST
jgi:hypothetical protein